MIHITRLAPELVSELREWKELGLIKHEEWITFDALAAQVLGAVRRQIMTPEPTDPEDALER